MTTITSLVVEDSISRGGIRITTMQLRYPRFIHDEFLTHRAFSRNASSNRAIPVKRVIQDVIDDPVDPIYWGKNQPGMQAKEELTGEAKEAAQASWNRSRAAALVEAKEQADIGAHKQVVNRILMPYMHINTVVTSTEWDNFFNVRDHEDADPHIQPLAQAMKAALEDSIPVATDEHWPYILPEEVSTYPDPLVLRSLSAARCARVSYMTHENKKPDFEEDLKVSQKLLRDPWHPSPYEHAAHFGIPDVMYANFKGWKSARWQMENPGVF